MNKDINASASGLDRGDEQAKLLSTEKQPLCHRQSSLVILKFAAYIDRAELANSPAILLRTQCILYVSGLARCRVWLRTSHCCTSL